VAPETAPPETVEAPGTVAPETAPPETVEAPGTGAPDTVAPDSAPPESGATDSLAPESASVIVAAALPATCTTSATVRAGSVHGARCVETRLLQLGWTAQVPDDYFNPTSVGALRGFQASVGLTASGVGDPATLQALGIWRAPPAATCRISATVRSGSFFGARCVESRLVALGWTGLSPDDRFSAASVAALRLFQASAGLAVDGVAGPTTLAALGIWRAPPAPTCSLSITVRRSSVAGARCVEGRLAQLGWTAQAADDTFNAASVTALANFQASEGLPPDGVAGPATLAALGMWRAPPAPGCTVSNVIEPQATAGVSCLEGRLRQLGLTAQLPDAAFNATSSLALSRFQFSVGLPSSGLGDRPTLIALGIWKQPAGCTRCSEVRLLGPSVLGAPIRAYRFGTPGGRVVVVVGSIHGDEQAGLQIARYLQSQAVIPAGVDLWVVDTINPDGVARFTRTNANGVDLNRNFPVAWLGYPCSTNPSRCPGPGPASEPETRHFQAFVMRVRPSVVIFYHGADNAVDGGALTAVADPSVVTTYANAAGMRIVVVPCRPLGTCTGTATRFVNRTIAGSSAFVVELATKVAALSSATIVRHVAAIFRAVS
jgi:peptidoglycan hydrolase-like protein with peptidoglycan-binding domain